MALKIIDHGSKEYQQMVQLRNDILRRPLGLLFTPEELEKEKDEILIGAFDEPDIPPALDAHHRRIPCADIGRQ